MDEIIKKREERVDQAEREREVFHDSSSEQFRKYMEDNCVMEIFQPALSLLYEMPVKPENLYEFFAEFLENGAVDLLKISHLEAELCYKRAELRELHREFQEIWEQKNSVGDERDEQRGLSMTRPSGSFDSLKPNSLMNLDMTILPGTIDFLPVNELETVGGQVRSKSQEGKEGGSAGTQKIFKLKRQKEEWGDFGDLLGSTGSKASSDTVTTHSSFGSVTATKKEDEVKEPPSPPLPTTNAKTDEQPGKKAPAEKVNLKRKNKEEVTPPKELAKMDLKAPRKDSQGKKGGTQRKGGKKGDSDRAKVSQVVQTKEEGTMTDVSALNVSEKKSSAKQSSRRITKLVSGIEDPEQRRVMENVLMMIADHKKLDPSGILFDFNWRTTQREYELELFARGASEELLRKLTIHKYSNGEHTRLDGGKAETPISPFIIPANGERRSVVDRSEILYNAEGKPIKELKLSEEEVKQILKEQNHRRLVRDGLKFLHGIRKERMKRQRMKRSIEEGTDPGCSNCQASDSEQEGSSEDDSVQRSGQLLRMLRETFSDCVQSNTRNCPVPPLEGQFQSPFQPLPSDQPEIVITADGETPADRTGVLKVAPPTFLKRVSKKRIRSMARELYLDYQKHLELVSSLGKPGENSFYMGPNYENDLERRFQSSMRPRRDETLTAITSSLHGTLQKRRQVRLKDFLRKRGNCTNIGYTKLDPFSETIRKEEQRRNFAHGVPPMSEKECQRFLRRFDSKGHFDPAGIRTKTDFVYDFDLQEVKATQKWIDKTFPEWVWNLNEPLGDPALERDFEDDDDDNYVWLEDYDDDGLQQERAPREQQNTPIPPSDLEIITNFVQASELCGEDEAAAEPPGEEVKVLEESTLAQGTRLVYSQSLTSLLHTRAGRKGYTELKTSERARHYVQKSFNPLTKANILNSFPFEMLDED